MKMAYCRMWMVCFSALLAVKGNSVLTISDCLSGVKSVTEDSNVRLTCGQYYTQIEWYTSHDSQLRNYIGMCSGTSCNPTVNEQFSIRASYPYWYESELDIRNVTRQQALFFHCYDSDYRKKTSCRLRITVFPVYTDGSCSVNVTNWMVTGSCTIKGMYSSDNNYICRWTQGGNSNEGFGDFQAEPKSYLAENSRNYSEGVCAFSRPMPIIPGSYTYRMRVSPGAGVYFEKEILIDPPYQVKVNHNCPKYVFEGLNLSCACFASTTASPPALIVWDGTYDATLLLTNISRQMNTVRFTCRLQWGPNGYIKDSTSYRLNVAYGPSSVFITQNDNTTKDVSETIRFTCAATDVYPLAVFRWNVTCLNQTDYRNFSTCSLNFTQMVGSLSILCNASNTYFPDASFSYVYVLSSTEDKQKGKD